MLTSAAPQPQSGRADDVINAAVTYRENHATKHNSQGRVSRLYSGIDRERETRTLRVATAAMTLTRKRKPTALVDTAVARQRAP